MEVLMLQFFSGPPSELPDIGNIFPLIPKGEKEIKEVCVKICSKLLGIDPNTVMQLFESHRLGSPDTTLEDKLFKESNLVKEQIKMGRVGDYLIIHRDLEFWSQRNLVRLLIFYVM